MYIVNVEWIDVALHSAWLSKHEDVDLDLIYTVGYELWDDDRIIKIAQSNSTYIGFCAIQTIPKVGVVNITR